MTKIGQHKTFWNNFKKIKRLDSGECWPKLYKTLVNWKLLILTHLSMKIVTHILGKRYRIPIFLGAKFLVNPYFRV